MTGDARYRSAADWTFNSFLLLADGSSPWTVMVNSAGEFWIEEYPESAGRFHAQRPYLGRFSDSTTTGTLTRRDDAYTLAASALSAAERVAKEARRPGGVSRYCLKHGFTSSGYHLHHTLQLMQLYALSGNPTFAQLADLFASDYPTPHPWRRAVPGGRHSVSIRRPRRDPRDRALYAAALVAGSGEPPTGIEGRSGVWLQVSAGIFAGYWVQESPTSTFLIGIHAMRRTPRCRRACRVLPSAARDHPGRVVPCIPITIRRQGVLVLSPVHELAQRHVCGPASRHQRSPARLITAGLWTGYWSTDRLSSQVRLTDILSR